LKPRLQTPVRFLLCAALFSAALSRAQVQPLRDLDLMEGRGELLQFPGDITKVVISEPKIADALVVSPREVMVNAKATGHTTLVVWEAGQLPARYNINVRTDRTPIENFNKELGAELKAQIPDHQIAFTGNSELIVLNGRVGSPDAAKLAESLAATHAKKVVNLLEVPKAADPRQILLQVKFASIDRVGLSELGFNYFSRNDKTLGALGTQQFQGPRFSQLQFQDQQFSNSTVNFADLLNLFVFRPDLNIGATIRALQSRNLLQMLAEPNLITIEGKEANFVAGGEFPFPILTATTTGGAISPVLTVQFKPFGVQLGFTPEITPNGAIHLKVKPEVSSIDYSNSTTVQGVLIPALLTRRAQTEVILKDGESFAIAGLIDNRVIQTVSKVRGLGDIPYLGQLFRSRSTRKNNDELLVVITPHFVKPLPPGEVPKLPDMVETWLPTVREERKGKEMKQEEYDRKRREKEEKAKAKAQQVKPEMAGPSGYQEPKPPKP
jgi:pilus assembly protein CpaC